MNIVWFRQDLRVTDNPALFEASKTNAILPIFILDDENAVEAKMGAASRVWLHHALQNLEQKLDQKLNFYVGSPKTILKDLCKKYEVEGIFWNRCYEPWRVQRDTALKSEIEQQQIKTNSFNGSLLWEPWQIKKADGTPYQVFTPFYQKGCLTQPQPRLPLPIPPHLDIVKEKTSKTLDALKLLPNKPWHQKIISEWTPGEDGAQDKLEQFLKSGIKNYKTGRDFPDMAATSRLSPHLHFGEISPHQVWHATQARPEDVNQSHFLRELAWREFSYHQLFHHPSLAEKNLQSKFDHFPWQYDEEFLLAWQQGRTGYPIIDAGMRELWQTGYMHNRVRMIVGSFLVKNLLIHWHYGERWFWDCLFDADMANNAASWQWVAGCGADAAPYFRIFNPVLQAKKFDPEGNYIRRYVPELSQLASPYLFSPWDAPADTLSEAGIILGKDYPMPIVDLKISRESALTAYQQIKK